MRVMLNACGEHLTPIVTLLDTIQQTPTSVQLSELDRARLWAPLSALHDSLKADVLASGATSGSGSKSRSAAASEMVTAQQILDTMVADPFVEGPRVIQEYWCAKPEAAGRTWAVEKVDGSRWFRAMPPSHKTLLNKILSDNANWYPDTLTDAMRDVLQHIGQTLGPVMTAWIQAVRPPLVNSGVWTIEEARLLLRTLVLQVWRDAVSTDSWMYTAVSDTTSRTTIAHTMAVWARRLMSVHAKQQFTRLSAEESQRTLQQRSEMERTSVVMQFDRLNDDDLREAERHKMRFRMGRWAIAAGGFGGYNAELMEFEEGQRGMMGVGDASVEQVLTGERNGTPVPPPEEGYSVTGEAEDDA